MGVIFEKFGLFDFLGIMGPGIMSTAYYSLSYWIVTGDDNIWGIKSSFISIISLLMLSYLYGIILHEIGKLLFDDFERFNSETIKNKLLNSSSKPRFKMEREFKENMNEICGFVEIYNFNYILGRIKYSDCDKRRIDSYHSIYGQARGLMISFILHILTLLLLCLIKPETIANQKKLYLGFIIAFDSIMIILFFIRAYRYFLTWIRNVYIMFFFEFYNTQKITDIKEKQ